MMVEAALRRRQAREIGCQETLTNAVSAMGVSLPFAFVMSGLRQRSVLACASGAGLLDWPMGRVAG